MKIAILKSALYKFYYYYYYYCYYYYLNPFLVMKIILINLIVNYHMTTITIFITTSTIFIAILLIFIGVENQLGHRPVFRSSC